MLFIILLVIGVLLVEATPRQKATTESAHTQDKKHWTQSLLSQKNNTPCDHLLHRYREVSFEALSSDNQSELLHCIARTTWHHQRQRNQTANQKRGHRHHYSAEDDNDDNKNTPYSTCDIFMEDRREWKEYSVLERRLLSDCVWKRMVVDYLHQTEPSLAHLPRDLLTNPFRGALIVEKLFKHVNNIGDQYHQDNNLPLETLRSQSYQAKWVRCGLNVTHYRGLKDQRDLQKFRHHHTMKD
jgi:hypothetical protein